MPKIQFKRGLKTNLPVLNEGEPAFTTDTEEFFIGSKDGNVQLAKNDQIDDLQGQLNTTNDNVTNTNTRIDNLKLVDANSEVLAARGTFPLLGNRLDNVDTSLTESMNLSIGFFQKILANTTTIKLIGDSITEGVGATNHTVPSTNPVIFDNGTEVYHEGCYTCDCWANQFRNYITAHYPNITSFVNAGIGGKSTRWAMTGTNYQTWLGTNQDLVFVMLGMNDRSLGDFETNITNFLAYVKANCNNMIVMIPNPTLNDNPSQNVEVRTINDTIVKVCQKNGYFYISHYIDMLDFCQMSGNTLKRLVQTDGGSHPVDEGHLFIWNNIQKKLKFVDAQTNFENETKTTYLPLNYFTASNAPSDFPLGKSFQQVSSSNTAGFPENYAGVLETYVAKEDVSYSFQEYKVYGNGRKYNRYWYNGAWTTWYLNSYNQMPMNFATSSQLITGFPLGITYCVMQSDSTYGLPDNIGGTVITYNTNPTNQYNYQEFLQYGTNAKFIRNVQSDGTWGPWKGITTQVITKTLTFPSIASMTVNGQVVTIPAIDTSKYAYVVSPKSVLDTSLFFSYTVSGTSLYVRLLNTGSVSITPGSLDFDLTIIRK